MSFGATPNFDALEVAHSQAHKHHLQNILYYHNGKLRNYGCNELDDSLEAQELRKVISQMVVYEGGGLEFPCFKQSNIAQHIVDVIDSLFERAGEDSEVFIGNITISGSSGIKSVEWNDSSKEEIRRAILEDRAPVLKMDLYVALPYNESVLSEDSSSGHSAFLRTFQDRWGIVRPWRYVSVRNWIYVPRITVYGDEIYDLEVIGEYVRSLRSQIHRNLLHKELNYDVIRRFYAYLRTIVYFSEKDIQPRRFRDQITFHQMRKCEEEEVSKMLKSLHTFFEESSVSFVYSMLCDLRVQEHIKEVYSCIDPDFLQQSRQTVEYLLKEHHISCDTEVLEKYIESRLKEEIAVSLEEIENTILLRASYSEESLSL